jgi:hypothetical protein
VDALQDPPVAHDRRGVVPAQRAAVAARVAVEVNEADDGGDAVRRRGNALQGPLVRRQEAAILDQIADAVAGQRWRRGCWRCCRRCRR